MWYCDANKPTSPPPVVDGGAANTDPFVVADVVAVAEVPTVASSSPLLLWAMAMAAISPYEKEPF